MTKAQVSFFLIIAITLLGFALMLFYNTQGNTGFGGGGFTAEVRTYVESCLESVTLDGIYYNSLQGGYYRPISPSLDLYYYEMPYYYVNGEYAQPSIEVLEQELTEYVNEHFLFCLDDFSSFSHTAAQFEYEGPQSSVSIRGTTTIDLSFPLKITQNERSSSMQRFRTEIDSEFNKVLPLVDAYIEKQKEKPNYIRTSYLVEIAEENDLVVSLVEYDTGIVIIELTGRESRPFFSNYTFSFAMKYDWEDSGSSTVVLEEIPNLDATIGYDFEYGVEFTGNNVRLEDDSSLFDITNEGLIQFNPTYEDSGEHIITVTATDEQANTKSQTFSLTVENFGYKPEIEPIGFLNAKQGELFSWSVSASSPSNHALYYFDDADVFDIGKETGLIEFTPIQPGSHSFIITVIDEKGLSNSREGHIIVE